MINISNKIAEYLAPEVYYIHLILRKILLCELIVLSTNNHIVVVFNLIFVRVNQNHSKFFEYSN